MRGDRSEFQNSVKSASNVSLIELVASIGWPEFGNQAIFTSSPVRAWGYLLNVSYK